MVPEVDGDLTPRQAGWPGIARIGAAEAAPVGAGDLDEVRIFDGVMMRYPDESPVGFTDRTLATARDDSQIVRLQMARVKAL